MLLTISARRGFAEQKTLSHFVWHLIWLTYYDSRFTSHMTLWQIHTSDQTTLCQIKHDQTRSDRFILQTQHSDQTLRFIFHISIHDQWHMHISHFIGVLVQLKVAHCGLVIRVMRHIMVKCHQAWSFWRYYWLHTQWRHGPCHPR